MHIAKTILPILGAVCLALACPSASSANPAAAGKAPKISPKESFEKMDADKNGSVSKEEFLTKHKSLKPEAFNAIDTNRDGILSFEEWESFCSSHGMGKQEAMPSMPKQEAPASCPASPSVMPPIVKSPADGQ